MQLGPYSFGLGDRFEHEAPAQLAAVQRAAAAGATVTPVWNKSHREHQTLGTQPADTRRAADEAVEAVGWEGGYFVDADHITLQTVRPFVSYADYFTIDITEQLGQPADLAEVTEFIWRARNHVGKHTVPGLDKPLEITRDVLRATADNFWAGAQQAAEVYRYLVRQKGEGTFVTEVSMDEVETPQTPAEIYLVLLMLVDLGVQVNNIAPKFVGQFNKGIDYVGNIKRFRREFENNVVLVKWAQQQLELPDNLKLSMHSGSDKFSIYPAVRETLRKHEAGLHVKTAGTTFLEELIGLAKGSDDALALVKKIYAEAFGRYDELTDPYRHVIDVKPHLLPTVEVVQGWSGDKFADALRYHRKHPNYNPAFRQFMHCAYKVAGEQGPDFTDALKTHRTLINENVTENIYEHHLRPLFVG